MCTQISTMVEERFCLVVHNIGPHDLGHNLENSNDFEKIKSLELIAMHV